MEFCRPSGYAPLAAAVIIVLGSIITLITGVVPGILVLKRGGRLARSLAMVGQLGVAALIITGAVVNANTGTSDETNLFLIGVIPSVLSAAMLAITLRE
jgi:hypothetical protein